MSVCVFYVVILLFEWLYHLLGVEFGKTETVDGSRMLKTIGNRSYLVENGSEMGWTGQETGSGRRAVRWGWTENILGNILLARLSATQIWRAWTPVVFFLWARRLRVGYSDRSFRRRVWATSCFDETDVCTSEFVWMNPTLWSDQNMFLTTLKIQVYPKTLLFSDERGSDTNCWWEKPLVVALEHLEGIKHTVLFQNNKLTKYKQKLLIHTFSFSLVFLSYLSHTQ